MLSERFEEVAIIEKEIQQLSLGDLNALRSSLSSRIEHLQNEISDLAFNNYRTYADAGRTAEHSKGMFSSISKCTSEVKHDLPTLMENIEKFHENSNAILKESDMIEDILDRSCPIWELLQLPKVMEKCIRAGQYESAYALTNFALSLKQSKLVKYPLIKHVVDVLIEARHGLLDELFNKFAGPIDLAKSIQVVNNIRKIPYISNTQLRVSILQYRDVYLEKQVMGIMSEPDFLLKVIEVYRDCMYDTMVLYLAVFPESDLQRRYNMSDDPRWERWTGSSQSFLLQSWAHRNIDRLFDYIRLSDSKSSLDIEAMSGKFMSFALSFGRMGMDFRNLILQEFHNISMDLFRKKVDFAIKNITSLKKLTLIDGDIFENTRPDLEITNGVSRQDLPLSAPLELCVWDDLCVFGNEIIEALNDMRHTMSVNQVNDMFTTLKLALQKVTKWIDGFFKTDDVLVTKRAIRIYLTHFVPFISRCFLSCFSYEKCYRPYFRGAGSSQDYETHYDLLSKNLFELCENEEIFESIFKEIIEARQARPAVFRVETPDVNGGPPENEETGNLPEIQANGNSFLEQQEERGLSPRLSPNPEAILSPRLSPNPEVSSPRASPNPEAIPVVNTELHEDSQKYD